jgi:putative nucleotidyltransferase with HDIG domain
MSKTKPKRNIKTKLPSRSIEECVSRIEDRTIRLFVAKAFREAPKYFWTASSSSSGKHHPVDEHGKGGLVLHTVRVFNVAEVFVPALVGSESMGVHPDVIRAGALLHDLYRYGTKDVAEDTTNKLHAELAAKALSNMVEDFPLKKAIIFCVERHMGKWGQVLPNSMDEWLVHFADGIATKYYPQRDDV